MSDILPVNGRDSTVEQLSQSVQPYETPLITQEVDPSDKLQLAQQAVKELHDARYNPWHKRVPDMSDAELLQFIEWHQIRLSYLTNHAVSRRIELDKQRYNKDNRIAIDPSTKPQLPPRDKAKKKKDAPISTLGITDTDKLRKVYIRRAGTDKELAKLYKLLFDNNWQDRVTNFGQMSKAQLKEAVMNLAMGG